MHETKSAGGVVLNPRGQVLLVKQHGRTWSLPKGHLDEGEDALTAAKREIAEEAGITNLEMVKNLGSYKRYKIGLNHETDDTTEIKEIEMFLFRTDQVDVMPQDETITEAKWIDKEHVREYLVHQKDKDFFAGIMKELAP